jgi:3-oxoacyl-[acyl-carrier protein] reductase
MNIDGKVALVTGAAQGLGRATVERFVQAEASGVMMADIQGQKAENAAKEIMATCGGRVLSFETDVSNESQVQAAVQSTLREFGKIDILVNNAGVFPVVPWDDVTLESWNRMLEINLTGMFLFVKAVLPSMKAQKHGRIVFVSSGAAFTGSAVAHVAYGVSKAGIIALMMSVAKGFAAYNIRANAIAPGPVDTPGAHDLGDEFWTATEQKTLLKRHGSALELADAILYLVSDRSSYITGQCIAVDGGWMLG